MDEDLEELYGKRKRKRIACPNPLFEKWLTEWRDEAALKGWKSQYNYAKALDALKKFPLRLEHGKDCKMLKNFGEKTCKMLDMKLAEHNKIYGATAQVSMVTSTGTTSSASTSTILSTSNQNSFSSVNSTNHTASINLTLESSDSENGDKLVKKVTKKRRKSSGSREYIPAYRSGGYAILLALYTDRQAANCKGYLTKIELIRDAQPLADKSFTEPDPGNAQWYTAWSSMATLLKKGLVIKERSPAQFSLSETGCALAHRLLYVDEHSTLNDTPVGVRQDQGEPRLSDLDIDDNKRYVNDDRVSELRHTPTVIDDNRLQYCFITEDNLQVVRKDKAAVTIDDDIGLGFLIKVNYQKLIMSGKNYSLDLTRPFKEEVYAYLADKDADDIAVPENITKDLPDKSVSISKPSSSSTFINKSSTSTTTQKLTTTSNSIAASSFKPSSSASTSSNRAAVSSSSASTSSNRAAVSSSSHKTAIPSSSGTSSHRPEPSLLTLATRDNSQSSSTTVTSLDVDADSQSSTVSSTSSLPVPEFVLRPGEFEVVLVIDNREFYGSSKSNTKTLLPDLMKNKVNCDLRELHVGDLVWIAREKVPHIPGQLRQGEGRELVLDYIVERKRMDDLVSSMVDGRLLDQKFRLKRCGVKNAIFLIENYGSMQNFSIGEDRIKQSIANTQVIDGFGVKRVKDTKESVLYLTVMTRYLQNYYQNKTLHACSPDVVKEINRPFNINNTEHYLMPFQNFNLGSVKSKALTVSEMFGKQLIQLNGMSADKAKGVIDNYPTPISLVEAYARCPGLKEKEQLLAGIKCGKLTRNLGLAQSKQIAGIYCTTGALT